MKISNESAEQLNKSVITEQLKSGEVLTDKPLQQMTKSLMELAAGDRFTALVTDIRPGSVVLKMPDGNVLNAKSLLMPDAHIGDEAVFQVKENVKGQILLEMVKPSEQGAGTSIVKEALSAANMQFTKQNAEIVNMLIKANLPIDSQTVQKAAYFKYTAPEMSEKEIVFLVKESFPANEKTIETYKGLVDKTIKLDKSIRLLLNEIENTEILKEKVPQLRNKLILNPKERNFKNIGDYFRETGKSVELLKTELTKYKIQGEVINKQLDNIKDNLKFMDNVNQHKQFMQIPFTVDGQINQAELHVFSREKGGADAKNDNATAVLALDYDNMGHVEVVINKINKSVSLQFKGGVQRAVELLRENSPKLIETLQEKGYEIMRIGFEKTEEKFDITDGIEHNKQEGNPDIKRYSFDMRV